MIIQAYVRDVIYNVQSYVNKSLINERQGTERERANARKFNEKRQDAVRQMKTSRFPLNSAEEHNRHLVNAFIASPGAGPALPGNPLASAPVTLDDFVRKLCSNVENDGHVPYLRGGACSSTLMTLKDYLLACPQINTQESKLMFYLEAGFHRAKISLIPWVGSNENGRPRSLTNILFWRRLTLGVGMNPSASTMTPIDQYSQRLAQGDDCRDWSLVGFNLADLTAVIHYKTLPSEFHAYGKTKRNDRYKFWDDNYDFMKASFNGNLWSHRFSLLVGVIFSFLAKEGTGANPDYSTWGSDKDGPTRLQQDVQAEP